TFPTGSRVLPSHSEIQRQLAVNAKVILKINEVLMLSIISDQVARERVLAAQSKKKVGNSVAGRVIRDRAVGWEPENSACRPRKGAVVCIATIKRVNVLHLRTDHLKLIARLHCMSTADQ